MKLHPLFSTLTVVSLLISLQPAMAANTGAIEFKSIAEVDTVMTDKAGNKETKRILAKKVAPGGVVIYTTSFKNVINKPVGNIVITNPIPANTEYLPDSATGTDTVITYSVDAGKSYNNPEKLTVKNAEGKVRPALASDYTDIKWLYKNELAPNKSSVVVFKAQVK